jgi:PLP dependent protein
VPPNHRPAEVVASLASVRARLTDYVAAAGRDPRSVTLIAVTKTFPSSDVSILLSLGILDIGESRDQEARAKLAELTIPAQSPAPRLHFVGRLQRNKCRSVARYAYCVHTVDRVEVATALADGVEVAGREPLPVYVQVSLDGDPARGGVGLDEVDRLADAVAADERLRLTGVMAVAPIAEPAAEAYARLAEVSANLRANHPSAVAISAGMSDDFGIAVKYGATHVRIGSALLGRRAASFS